MAADPRVDELLMGLAARHDDVLGLLTTLFSFLHRKTDFYVVDSDPARRVGFAPGAAEKLVRGGSGDAHTHVRATRLLAPTHK